MVSYTHGVYSHSLICFDATLQRVLVGLYIPSDTVLEHHKDLPTVTTNIHINATIKYVLIYIIIYIKNKMLMPAKSLQVSANIKSIISLWDRRQVNPTCICRISLILILGIGFTSVLQIYI